jgi:hypothetical protein
MRIAFLGAGVLIAGMAIVLPSSTRASHGHMDFGTFVESQLAAHTEQLFGFEHPLDESALGPYDGPNCGHPSLGASRLPRLGSVTSAADQIAMRPGR